MMNPLLKVCFYNYGSKSLNLISLNEEEFDVSYCFDIRSGITIEQTRDGLSGINKAVSLPNNFYEGAHELIKSLYSQYGINAHCEMRVYQRDPIKCLEYTLMGEYILDFDTIEINRDYTAISCYALTLDQYVNSNYSTKYDIKLDGEEITSYSMEYDHITLEHARSWLVLGGSEVRYKGDSKNENPLRAYYYPQADLKSNDRKLRQNKFNVKTANEVILMAHDITDSSQEDIPYLIKNISSETQKVGFTLSMNVSLLVRATGARDKNFDNQSAVLQRIDYSRSAPVITTIRRVVLTGDTVPGEEQFQWQSDETELILDISDIELPSKSVLVFGFDIGYESLNSSTASIFSTLTINSFDYLNISYFTASSSTDRFFEKFQYLQPEMLLNKLLDLVTGEYTDYKSEILWREDDKTTLHGFGTVTRFGLLPAESIRGYDTPVIHTSFKDFTDWMRSLGYMPNYPDKNTMQYVYYEDLFVNEVKHDITEHEVNNLQERTNTTYAITHMRFGYNVPNNEVESGKYEVNGLFEYRTGVIKRTDNVYEIISPYRADNLGIETLSWERSEEGKKSTDNKSDNDVFVVDLEAFRYTIEENGHLITVLATRLNQNNYYEIPGTPIKIFNAYLCPSLLGKRWQKLIAVSTYLLTFTSTDLYRNAVLYLNGVQRTDLYDDLLQFIRIFSPTLIEFDCINVGNLLDADKRNGLVRLVYENTLYTGYIMNSLWTFLGDEVSKVTLFRVSRRSI